MSDLDPELVRAVHAAPGFVAFCALIGRRVQAGQSLDAYRMLEDVGAPPELAHEILEGWRPEEPLASALALASLVRGFERYDWPALLARAVSAAHRARREDADEKISGNLAGAQGGAVEGSIEGA